MTYCMQLKFVIEQVMICCRYRITHSHSHTFTHPHKNIYISTWHASITGFDWFCKDGIYLQTSSIFNSKHMKRCLVGNSLWCLQCVPSACASLNKFSLCNDVQQQVNKWILKYETWMFVAFTCQRMSVQIVAFMRQRMSMQIHSYASKHFTLILHKHFLQTHTHTHSLSLSFSFVLWILSKKRKKKIKIQKCYPCLTFFQSTKLPWTSIIYVRTHTHTESAVTLFTPSFTHWLRKTQGLLYPLLHARGVFNDAISQCWNYK